MAEIFKAFADIGKGIAELHDYRKDVAQRRKEKKLRRYQSESDATFSSTEFCYTPKPPLRNTKSDSNMISQLPIASKQIYQRVRSDSERITPSAPPDSEEVHVYVRDKVDGHSAAILSSSPARWSSDLPTYEESQKAYSRLP